jgi:hypothetical protein
MVQGQGARRFVEFYARIEIEAVARRGPIFYSALSLNLRHIGFEAQAFDLDAVLGKARRQVEFAEPVFAARITDAAGRAVESQVDDLRIVGLRLGGRLNLLDVRLDPPRKVFEVDCASVERRDQAGRVESDRF